MKPTAPQLTTSTPAAASIQQRLAEAMSLHQHGKLAQAEAMYKSILGQDTGQLDALHLLGVLACQTGRAAVGVQLIEQAARANPSHAGYASNLGNGYMALGRYPEAAQAYARATRLQPSFAEAHCNLGNALRALRRPTEAVDAYLQALTLSPDLPEAHGNLGNTFNDLQRHAEALAHLDRAIALRPQYPEAHGSRGVALAALGRTDEALKAFDQAIMQQPDSVEAWANRGTLKREQGALSEGAADLREALRLRPSDVNAMCNLAVTLQEAGDLDSAIVTLRKALETAPDHLRARSNLLFALSFDPNTPPDAYLREARDFGDIASRAARPFSDWTAPALGDGTPLRVGVVSGDLRQHPVGLFLEGMLTQLQGRVDVELHALPTDATADALTDRLRPLFTGWHSLVGLDDETAARQIHSLGLHVLLDLSGHTAGNRLPVFAWRPAPVQASWLGYLASTGVPAIDYIVADPVSVPPEHDGDFTERVWRLPGTINCFTAPGDTPALRVTDTPALARGHITFGSYQNPTKIGSAVLDTWGRVLRAVPGARLRLQSRLLDHAAERDALLARLQGTGIEPDRVLLHGAIASREAHLASHAEVDILLDTFPYPGITTTCEALWMGVPTVTLAGRTMLARQGAALLGQVGLADWVAGSADDYVAVATRHAQDIQALQALRQGLRARAAASPLFDATRFAQTWWSALRDMALTSPAARRSP